MLRCLIDQQTIIVDAHKRGNREDIYWDKSANDIHIDKKTKRTVRSKQITAHIRIPINSDEDFSVEIMENVSKPKKVLESAEIQIVREIKKAFANKKVREEFINSLVDILQNYPTNLSSTERAETVMRRLARHFGLSEQLRYTLIERARGRIDSISAIVTGADNSYFINLDRENITIGETTQADYFASNGKGF